MPGTDFERHFDAEIAAGNHQCVGEFDDLVDALDGLRLFDLRHQADPAAGDLADFGEIFRTLDEGKRDPVDVIGCQHGIEIDAVLVRKRADAKQRVGKADALPVGNLGAGNDRRDDALAVALFGAQCELAVIDQQAVARLDRFEDFRMRQEDTGCVAGRVIVVEREGLAGLQIDLGVGKLADAKLRALQVGQNADRAAGARLDRADALDQRAHQVMACMAHVDAENVGTGLVQLLDHRFFAGGGAERGEDFYFSVTLHQFWLSCVPGVSDS